MVRKFKKSLKIFLLLLIVIIGFLGAAYGLQAQFQIVKTEVSLEKRVEVAPDESVVVDFSFPVLSSDYANGIKISPTTGVNFQWENSGKLKITPQKFWSPETSYQITLPQGGVTLVLSQIEQQQLNFSTVSYPRVVAMSPAQGAQEVLLDMEAPIVVDFDKSTQGFFIKFMVDPWSDIAYQNNPDKTEFRLLPKESVRDGQQYNVKIYIKYAQAPDADYVPIYESNFETFSPASVVWEKNYELRLVQAKKYARAKITAGKYIDINLSAQVMTIFQEGKALNAYMISSGKRGMDTPKGTFKIENKTPRAWSKEYGLYMPNWMAIVPSGKFGIHELPEWPGGYKEGAAHLGTPVSHGCVRLGVGAAKTVYDFAPIGTPVVIY
ncbi:MAG: L,D-transpeptidase family protein [Parcubacteria group bacterium]|jgi:lipoprotein-anchoring transpeptidase ErfK/SrfK